MLVTGLFRLVTLGAYPGFLALDRGYSVSPFVSSLTVQSQYGTLVVHTGQGFLIFGIVVYAIFSAGICTAWGGSLLPPFYTSRWTIENYYYSLGYAILWHRCLADNYSNTRSRSE